MMFQFLKKIKIFSIKEILLFTVLILQIIAQDKVCMDQIISNHLKYLLLINGNIGLILKILFKKQILFVKSLSKNFEKFLYQKFMKFIAFKINIINHFIILKELWLIQIVDKKSLTMYKKNLLIMIRLIGIKSKIYIGQQIKMKENQLK